MKNQPTGERNKGAQPSKTPRIMAQNKAPASLGTGRAQTVKLSFSQKSSNKY